MLAYYSGLVAEYGGLHAYYRNAICLIMDEEHIYESMDETFERTISDHVGPTPGWDPAWDLPLTACRWILQPESAIMTFDPAELGKVAAEDGSRRFLKK